MCCNIKVWFEHVSVQGKDHQSAVFRTPPACIFPSKVKPVKPFFDMALSARAIGMHRRIHYQKSCTGIKFLTSPAGQLLV